MKKGVHSGRHRYRLLSFSGISMEINEPQKSCEFEVGLYSFVMLLIVFWFLGKIGDHKWQIVCYPGGETPQAQDYVSFFVGYKGPEIECLANWRLT